MVLTLLSFLCNLDDLTPKVHQHRYLDEGWLFIGRFKVGSVPGMINKEVFAQFIFKPT